MTEEIKEMLKEMQEYASGGMTGLYFPENMVQDLLDYITNLQQENERLKEDIRQDKVQFECFELAQECDNRQDKIDLLTNQLKDYKSRCEKATEELTYMSTDAYTDNYDIRDKYYNLFMNILNRSDEK